MLQEPHGPPEGGKISRTDVPSSLSKCAVTSTVPPGSITIIENTIQHVLAKAFSQNERNNENTSAVKHEVFGAASHGSAHLKQIAATGVARCFGLQRNQHLVWITRSAQTALLSRQSHALLGKIRPNRGHRDDPSNFLRRDRAALRRVDQAQHVRLEKLHGECEHLEIDRIRRVSASMKLAHEK